MYSHLRNDRPFEAEGLGFPLDEVSCARLVERVDGVLGELLNRMRELVATVQRSGITEQTAR